MKHRTRVDDLVEELATFTARHQEWLRSELKPQEMSHFKRKVLKILHDSGPQRMSDLATAFELDPKRMTEKIDALEQEGLVRRMPHPEDRRSKVVQLTDSGITALVEAEPVFQQAGVRLLDSLDERQLDDLHELLSSLIARLTRLRTTLPTNP